MAELKVTVDVATGKAIANMKKFETTTNAGIARMSSGMDSLKGLIAGVAIGAFVKKSVSAFDAQEKAVASVRNGLELTKDASGKTLDGLLKQASELQKNSLFGDEQILSDVTAQFLTFGNITGTVFDRAQQATVNLAAKTKKDLQGTGMQLAKALDDPIKGVNRLSLAGVLFTDQQKAQIKVLQESGDTMGAQNIILTELEDKYGGAAATAAKAGSGPLKQLQMRFEDITEIIGEGLMPILTAVGNVLGKVATVIENNKEAFMGIMKAIAIVIGLIATVIVIIKTVSAVMKGWVIVMKIVNFVMALNPIIAIIAAIVALIAIIVVVVRRYRGWGDSFKAIGKIIKLSVVGLVDSFKTEFKLLGTYIDILSARFTMLKENISNIFNNIGKAIKLAIKGDFTEARAALTADISADDAALKASKKRQEQIRKEYRTRKLARDLEMKQLAKNISLTKKSGGPGGPVSPVDPSNLDPDDDDKKDDAVKKPTDIAAKAGVKNININIDKIIENSYIKQNEDPLVIQQMVADALTRVIADSEVYA